MRTILIAIIAGLMCSCATLQNIETKLGTPAQVQSEVTALGALAKPYIPASAQTQIHNAAVQLNAATTVDFNALAALLPVTGNAKADALIGAVKAYIALAGPQIEYVHAVGAGLLLIFK